MEDSADDKKLKRISEVEQVELEESIQRKLGLDLEEARLSTAAPVAV